MARRVRTVRRDNHDSAGRAAAQETQLQSLRGFLRRHALIIGILLMFAFTWPINLSGAGVLPIRFPYLMYVFMGWGFIAASLLMTWLTLGGGALLRLLKRYVLWDVGIEWYLALLIIPAAYLIAIAIHAVLNGVPIDLSSARAYAAMGSWQVMLVSALPVLLMEAIFNGEEIGWRGYALPRLQSRFDALYSALVVGLIWVVWHIPFFIGTNPAGHGWYILGVLAKSVFITWIYNGTRGSLLLATLCHAMWNTASFFLPVSAMASSRDIGTYAYVISAEVAAAIVIILWTGRRNLSRTQPRQVEGWSAPAGSEIVTPWRAA